MNTTTGNEINETKERVKIWVRKEFILPKTVDVVFKERTQCVENSSIAVTDITITFSKNHSHSYTISKPISSINYGDIKTLRNQVLNNATKRRSIFSTYCISLDGGSVFLGFMPCLLCARFVDKPDVLLVQEQQDFLALYSHSL